MMTYRRRKTARHCSESGQALVFLVLALSIFFLAAGALSVDMSNLWFHRQAAQNAADAACTAGAMDLLVDAQGGATGHQGFVNGAAFNCSVGSTAAPCQYAAKNGYTSNNASPGSLVSVSFPTSVTGVPTSALAPTTLVPTAFMRVDVTDNVQTYFSGMLSGQRSQTVRSFAVCGVVLAQAPIPILVLDPHNPVTSPSSKALDIQGSPTIKIVGGPTQSIQVNSDAGTAVNVGGSATIDLTKGGINFDGSDFGTYGGPATAPGGFVTANGGKWMTTSPIADPFAQIPAPALPADPTSATPVCNGPTIQAGNCNVLYLAHGCPDSSGCTLFTAGYYPNGICIGNGGCGAGIAKASKLTAIFDPGIYYVNGGMQLMSKAMVRPGNGAGDGTGGTVFYLTGTVPTCSGQPGLICVGSNSGSEAIDPFNTSAVTCPGGTAPDPQLNLPATLPGNVLLAPCTGTYGDPQGKYRGILFFQDRASGGGGGWGGGGGFLLAGSMYFHHCNAAGTGVSCGANPTYYNSIFTLQGNSGSASYVLGDIITDNLAMAGGPTINMALNPNSAYSTLKATLLR
jgi:hypothetical protein